jgi:porin
MFTMLNFVILGKLVLLAGIAFVFVVMVADYAALAQDNDPQGREAGVRKHEGRVHGAPHKLHEVTEERRTPDDFSKPWTEWQHATGDWKGGRPWLDDHGITLEIDYLTDFLTNIRGGMNTNRANTYRGLLQMSATLDTETMGLWEGGTFFIDFQQIHGRDISIKHVGDLQALSNLDAPDRTQVAEYWYEHNFFGGKLRAKIGKIDVNADFNYVDYGIEHIHSSPGVNPTVYLMPQYPDPALGVSVFVEPADWIYFGGGIYDGQAEGNRWGFETTFHGRDDSFTIFELGFRPTLELGGQKLPGVYRVGGWYHSGVFDVFMNDLDGRLPARSHRGNAGVYFNFDQLLYRENPELEDDDQGLGMFFQFGWAPSAYNEISQYYGFGGQYVGSIPTRDEDITGFGLYHVSLSGRVQSLEGRYSETAIELFHKFQITPFFSLKPDIQYIVNPGGDGRDALVAGIRMQMTF